MSILSFRLTNTTPRLSNCSTKSSKSFVDRPNRERLSTTTLSPARSLSNILFSSGLSRFVPVIFSVSSSSMPKVTDDKKVLSTSRIVTLLICVLGIGVSLASDSIVQMMYVGGLFYGTAVFIPMVMALYWKRGTAQAALAAIISSIVVGLYSEYFLSGQVQGLLGMPSNLLATLVGLAVFFVVSLVTPPPKESQLRVIEESKRMQS